MADQRPGRTAHPDDPHRRLPTVIISPARGGIGRWTVPPVPIDTATPTAAQRAALRRYVAAKFAAPADLGAVGDSTRTAPPATEETR